MQPVRVRHMPASAFLPALPVYLTEESAPLKRVAARRPPPQLMERAGLAAAQIARDRLLDGKRVCPACSPALATTGVTASSWRDTSRLGGTK